MATKDEQKAKALKYIVEEQRRDYDYLLHIYDRTRATESILLTATYGILIYLYSASPIGTKMTIAGRLFFPTEDYGKAIYLIAASFFYFSLIKLTLTVFGNNPWETTYNGENSDGLNELTSLEHIKKRYDECHEYNANTYLKRKKNLEFLFFCILISAIILIAIKTLR